MRGGGAHGPTSAALFLLASLATAAVGFWLLWVTAIVLPARDPEHIPMWRIVAACFFAYGVLSWICLATAARNTILRWSVFAASLGAVTMGLVGAVGMMRRSDEGGHFEGYIVLMGIILCGHGVSGLLYTLLAGRAGRADAAPDPGVATLAP